MDNSSLDNYKYDDINKTNGNTTLEKVAENINTEEKKLSSFISYKEIDIIPIDGQKLFKTNNTNVIILDSNNLLIYWDWEKRNLNKVYKMNLVEYIKDKNIIPENYIYIYRNWKILKWKLSKSKNSYINDNNIIIRIFFWDIISFDKEHLEKQVLDIDKIENEIWFINLDNIKKLWNAYILDIRTEYKNKSYSILYKKGENLAVKKEGLWHPITTDFLENKMFFEKIKHSFKMFLEKKNRFDEPIDEPKWTQEDWKLRRLWLESYWRWKSSFMLRDIMYEINTENWYANIPQVCIDFIMDYYELYNWAKYENNTKTWKLDFDEIIWKEDRRRVRAIVNSLKTEKWKINDYFSIVEVPKEHRVNYKSWELLIEKLRNYYSKNVKVWDTLIIEWKLHDWLFHQHSVIVSKIEANWNIKVYENPAFPVENNLHVTLSRWPKRTINYIIKAKDNILDIYNKSK